MQGWGCWMHCGDREWWLGNPSLSLSVGQLAGGRTGMGSPLPGSQELASAIGHRGARGQTPLQALHGVHPLCEGWRLRGSTAAQALGADGRPLCPSGVSPERPHPSRCGDRGLGGAPRGRHRAPANTVSRCGAGRRLSGRWWWGCTDCRITGWPHRPSPSRRPVATPATTTRRLKTTCSCSRWGLRWPGKGWPWGWRSLGGAGMCCRNRG